MLFGFDPLPAMFIFELNCPLVGVCIVCVLLAEPMPALRDSAIDVPAPFC